MDAQLLSAKLLLVLRKHFRRRTNGNGGRRVSERSETVMLVVGCGDDLDERGSRRRRRGLGHGLKATGRQRRRQLEQMGGVSSEFEGGSGA